MDEARIHKNAFLSYPLSFLSFIILVCLVVIITSDYHGPALIKIGGTTVLSVLNLAAYLQIISFFPGIFGPEYVNYIIVVSGFLMLESVIMIALMKKDSLRVILAVVFMNVAFAILFLVFYLIAAFFLILHAGFLVNVVILALVIALFYGLRRLNPPKYFMIQVAWAIALLIIPLLINLAATLHPAQMDIPVVYFYGFTVVQLYTVVVFTLLSCWGVSLLVKPWICHLFKLENYWDPLKITSICSYLFVVSIVVLALYFHLKEISDFDTLM